MKKFLAICLVIIALGYLLAQTSDNWFPDIILTDRDGSWFDTRVYDDLPDAIAAAGTTNDRTLHIVRSEAMDNDLTIPSNLTLHFLGGGKIVQSSGTTTINASIMSGDKVILSTTGTGSYNFEDGMRLRTSWFDDFDDAVAITQDDTVTLVVSDVEPVTTTQALGDYVGLEFEGIGRYLYIDSGYVLSNISDIKAGRHLCFLGAGRADFNDGVALRTSWFERFDEAIRYIDNSAVALMIDRTETLSANTTVPIGVTLEADRGNVLTLNALLTVSGIVDVGPQQFIAASGSDMVFSTNSMTGKIYPQWWGAAGDGVTDDTDEIQSAIDSVPENSEGPGSEIHLTRGTYLVSDTLLVESDKDFIRIIGDYAKITGSDISGALLQIGDGDDGIREPWIEGIYFDVGGTTGVTALTMWQWYRGAVTNCMFKGTATGQGILMRGCWISEVKNSGFSMSAPYQMHVETDPTNSYESNGSSISNCWLYGNSVATACLYVDDESLNFMSSHNYYEHCENGGGTGSAITAEAFRFTSLYDKTESADISIVLDPLNGVGSESRGVDRVIGLKVSGTDGVHIDGGDSHYVEIQLSDITGEYVTIAAAAQKCYVEIPASGAAGGWSDLGDNNIIRENTSAFWAFQRGDLFIDQTDDATTYYLGSLYGWKKQQDQLSDANYQVTYDDCGKTLYSYSFTADRDITLFDTTANTRGCQISIMQKAKSYEVTIKPYSGEDIQYLAADQEITLNNAGSYVTLEVNESGGWIVASSNGRVLVPLDSDVTLNINSLIPDFTFNNTGATGTVTVTLPATVATDIGGDAFARFVRTESQTFRVDPNNTEQIRGGSGAGKYKELDSDGDILSLRNVVTDWWEVEVDQTCVNE